MMPLHHTAERIRVGRDALDVSSRQRNDRRAERHKGERPHPDRLIGEVAVDADGGAGENGSAEAQNDVDGFMHVQRGPYRACRRNNVPGAKRLDDVS